MTMRAMSTVRFSRHATRVRPFAVLDEASSPSLLFCAGARAATSSFVR